MKSKRNFLMIILLITVVFLCTKSDAYTDEFVINANNAKDSNQLEMKQQTVIKVEKDIKTEGNDIVNSRSASAPEGFLDYANADTIGGWAWRPDLPNTPIDIHLYLNNITTKESFGPFAFQANMYRSDLQSAGIGNGYHAFELLVNWNTVSAGEYEIVVFGIGSNNVNPSLYGCPKKYTVYNPTGTLDTVNDNLIEGWAWQASEPNEPIIVSITIYKDATNEKFGPFNIKADRYRVDLQPAGIGNGYHKFEANIDWNTFAPGTYKIFAKAIGYNNVEYNLDKSPKYYTKPAYAYATGGNFGIHGDSTSYVKHAEQIYKQIGYNTIADINPTKNDFIGYNNSRKKIESNIVFISGHGCEDRVVAPKAGLVIGGSIGNADVGIRKRVLFIRYK